MWIVDYIPVFFTHTLLLVSLLSFIVCVFFNMIPFVSQYTKQIQIVSVILLCATIYLEGGYAEKTKWELKVKDQQVQIAQYEAKSAEVTTKEVTKYVYKDKIIKQKGDVIEKEVIKWRDRIDATCSFPNATIRLLDSAADGKTISDTSSNSDGTSKTTGTN